MSKIDDYINALPDWQQKNITLFRNAVHEVYPNIEEAIKWNVPTFLIKGKMYFAFGAFKAHTKFNFMLNGSDLNDPHKVFNNGFDSKHIRSIDLREGETVNEAYLKELIKDSISRTMLS